MVDEAHSVGSLGKTGHGIEEHFDMPGVIDLKMGTMSKAIPSIGGYLTGTYEIVDYQRHMSRPFIFSAALPPAQTAAALDGASTSSRTSRSAWRSYTRTRRTGPMGSRTQGWDTMLSDSCVVPTLVGEENKTMDLTRMLFDRGIFVCPIVHPAVPRGMDRLRTTVMATHTREDLDKALDAFEESGKALGHHLDPAQRHIARHERPRQMPGPSSCSGGAGLRERHHEIVHVAWLESLLPQAALRRREHRFRRWARPSPR